jgi:hypothetical protein
MWARKNKVFLRESDDSVGTRCKYRWDNGVDSTVLAGDMPSEFRKKNNSLPASERSIVGSPAATNRQSKSRGLDEGPRK